MSEETKNSKLNPVTQKIIQSCIDEVLTDYINKTKYFTADSLHDLRTKVTSLVNQRIGSDEIQGIDIGLDLSALEDIPFFFRVNISKEKAEDHLLKD
jgi:hypothetical protein